MRITPGYPGAGPMTRSSMLISMKEWPPPWTKAWASTNELVGLAMKCGEINLKAMELLDAGNTGTYGHPVPTTVPLGAKKGKAILVSGHDLQGFRHAILKQTDGKGINVYTHGEMLPCHAYPGTEKIQRIYMAITARPGRTRPKNLPQFPGAIVMTTNCIQKPQGMPITENIFTTGLVGWPGVTHIASKDFTPAIERATGTARFYAADVRRQAASWSGFARNAVMGVAPQGYRGGERNKAIRHFLPGGGLRRCQARPQLLHGIRRERCRMTVWC